MFTMAFVFSGSALIPSASMTWPRNVRLAFELTFLWAQCYVGFFNLSENSFQMFVMFILCFSKNQNVIHLTHNSWKVC